MGKKSKWDPKAPQLKAYHFKPGQSGNPTGRPANPIPLALKKLTLQQYRRIIRCVVKGNIDEVKRIMKDPKSSMLEVALASSIIKAVARGDYDLVEKMLQRVVGKIPDKIIVESKNQNLNLNGKLDKEKVKEVLAELENEV